MVNNWGRTNNNLGRTVRSSYFIPTYRDRCIPSNLPEVDMIWDFHTHIPNWVRIVSTFHIIYIYCNHTYVCNIYIYVCLNGGVQPLQPGDDDEKKKYIYLYIMFYILCI